MDSSFTPSDVILRQYNNSIKMKSLIYLWWKAIRLNEFEDNLYSKIWDIDTCETHGLDIWGKIINIPRTMSYSRSGAYLGFREAKYDGSLTLIDDPQPFNTYPFYSRQYDTNGLVALSDQYYRKAIYMKAMANISDCTVPNLNRMLIYMFGSSGNAWVEHDGPMKMSYHFDFTPDEAELAIIQNSSILPRPSGCVISFVFEAKS